MKLRKCLIGALAVTGLTVAGCAQAALSYLTQGELLRIWGNAETGDVEKLKEKLTETIKTVAIEQVGGDDWTLARDLARQIEKNDVTTVAYGWCKGFVCPMMFLAGEERMFSANGRPESHYIEIPFMNGARALTLYNGVPATVITEWWRKHTKLGDGDMREYHEHVFVASGYSLYDYLDFFPAQAKFSKGNVVHCSGEQIQKGKSQYLADCMSVEGASALSKGIVTTNERFLIPGIDVKADIPVPEPTAFAPLESLPAASFKLSDTCMKYYESFLRLDSPRAFVINKTGGCTMRYAQYNRPYDSAMSACMKMENAGACRFYAVDDKVVFTPFDESVPGTTMAIAGSAQPALILASHNISLLLARNASKEDGPSGVSDKFTVEGKIVAYLTVKWDEATAAGGQQNLEVRWFSGDKLVSRQKQELTLSTSPHRVWLSTLAADIGSGAAHVEVYAQDKLIASKAFSVVEKM